MNAYHFITHWRVEGTCGEVADIIGDPLDLPRWWPAVYLEAEELAPPDARGVGRRIRLVTKGWLPYTLRWELLVAEVRYPAGSVIEVTGDLAGRGVWTFVQDGPMVDVTFDWDIRAEKPVLRLLSPVLARAFAANHRWAMAQGEASLRLELVRRRATTPQARAEIPGPPGPVTYAAFALVGGAAMVGGTLAYLMLRARRRRRRRRRRQASG